MKRRTLVSLAFLVVVLTLPSQGQTWTQETPPASPSTRRAGALAFEPLSGTTLLYGGLLQPTAIDNQTFSWDGTTWNMLTPATTPPPRWGHRMVFDTQRQVIVTFGGRSPTITATANDTWEWNGVDWTQVFPASSPSARAFYSMAYDERRGKTLVIGGQSTFTSSELWEYDGVTWTLAVTPTTFPGRETPMLVYDRGRGVTVLFGGWNGSSATMYSDTWEYDGSDWTQVITANSPIPRYRASAVYDSQRGRIVLYGGFGNATALTDTWEYDGNDWTQVASTGPARSTESFFAYDPQNAETVIFGGSGPTGVSNETWTYIGPQTAIFANFGHGCAGSLGLPSLTATLPQVGTNFTLTVGNLPLATTSTLLAIGLSNEDWLGNSLPLTLNPGASMECRLEVSPDLLQTLPVVGGSASLSAFFPNDPALFGLTFFTQAFTLDAGVTNGFSLTRGGRAVVGL